MIKVYQESTEEVFHIVADVDFGSIVSQFSSHTLMSDIIGNIVDKVAEIFIEKHGKEIIDKIQIQAVACMVLQEAINQLKNPLQINNPITKENE